VISIFENTDREISFSALGLSEPVTRALADLGYEAPTAIQVETISHLLEGRDLIGQAQTGTGKTAAFALPILDRLDPATWGGSG
jgi:ATP-dependent RNA helicase DeaD